MKSFLRFLTTLLVNSVPAVGWFFEQWSSGTTLAVYWFENLAACFFIGARILLHQRLAPKNGHFQYNAREQRGQKTTFFSSFMTIALIFTAAHGFFLFMIIFLLTHNGHGAEIGLSFESFGFGCLWVLGFLAADLAIDLPRLSQRSFAWLEQRANWYLGRIIVVHMTIILGMAAVAFTNATRNLFSVFIVLKTLLDLNAVIPQWKPKEPPRWLCRIMDKVPNVHPGESFAEFWKKDDQAEINRVAGNERPYTKTRK